jgi:hypothetical protein
MRQIVNLVAESVAQGKKVFILSDFIEMQIQVEKALLAYNPIRMPSSWGDEKRVEAMELFAHPCLLKPKVYGCLPETPMTTDLLGGDLAFPNELVERRLRDFEVGRQLLDGQDIACRFNHTAHLSGIGRS